MNRTIFLSYSVGGTAVAGVDYKTLKGSVTFKPGQFEAHINVKTLATDSSEGTHNLKIKLLPSASGGYILSPGYSKIKLTLTSSPSD